MKRKIDILSLLLILVKNKKPIIVFTLIASIAAVVYIMLVPQLWQSTASFIPQSENSSNFDLSSSLLNLSSSMFGTTFHTGGLELLSIMKSQHFSEKVIEEFDLISYFNIKDTVDRLAQMDIARKRLLEELLSISISAENGLVTIRVKTTDKYLSRDIANYYLDTIEEFNQSKRSTQGRRQKEFIQQRLADVSTTLDSLSYAMTTFQKRHHTIALEEQTRATISLYSELISKKLIKEFELESQNILAGEDNPRSKNLQSQYGLLSEKVKEFEQSNAGNTFMVSLSEVPELARQFAFLQLELEVQKGVYQFLYPQLEQARLQELKDTPTLEIIDRASPAGLRAYPRRGEFCIYMFVIAFILSSTVVLVINLLDTEQRKILQQIKKNLFCFHGKNS